MRSCDSHVTPYHPQTLVGTSTRQGRVSRTRWAGVPDNKQESSVVPGVLERLKTRLGEHRKEVDNTNNEKYTTCQVVVRPEVTTCQVVVRPEVTTCQVVVRPEVATCQVVVRPEVATCQVVVRPEVATCRVVVRPEVATCRVVVRPEVATCHVVVSLVGDTGEGSESVARVVSLVGDTGEGSESVARVVSLVGDTGEGSESVARVVSLDVEVERCRKHLHWLRPPNLVGMEANAYCVC